MRKVVYRGIGMACLLWLASMSARAQAPADPPPADAVKQNVIACTSEAGARQFCPADTSEDSQDLGTSYVYVPGAFMLLEPPVAAVSPEAHRTWVSRLITQRFQDGYLRSVPLLADSDDYHDFGGRSPRNAVFMDGTARPVKKTDGNTVPDGGQD